MEKSYYALNAMSLNMTGGNFVDSYANPNPANWGGSRWGIDIDDTNNLLFVGIWNIDTSQETIAVYNKTTKALLTTLPAGSAPSGYTFNGQAGLHVTSTNAGNYMVVTDGPNYKMLIWRYWMDGGVPDFELLNPVIDDSPAPCGLFWPGHVEIDDSGSGASIENYDIYVANRDGRVLRFESVE